MRWNVIGVLGGTSVLGRSKALLYCSVFAAGMGRVLLYSTKMGTTLLGIFPGLNLLAYRAQGTGAV
jgi:hypothetical protein